MTKKAETKAAAKPATAKENEAKIAANGQTDENAKSIEADGVFEPTDTAKITHNATDQGTATGKLPSLNADGTRPAETND